MKWLILAVYLLSVVYVHFRGRLRLPFRAQLADHSTFLAPLNVFMYLFSRAPTTPIVPVAEIRALDTLRPHWQTIRDEAAQLQACAASHAGEKSEDPNLEVLYKGDWNHFYLKWYDIEQTSARQLCPRTCALLQSIPAVKVATFAELPAGAILHRHRDPYAGWLRYHLGLSTPNEEGCFITVDGHRFAWRDGKALLFDETYIHWAANQAGRDRLVLLCFIERPMRFRWAQAVNRFIGRALMTATYSPRLTPEQRERAGPLSRGIRKIVDLRREMKSWNRAAYRASLAALAAALAVVLYLI